MSRSLSTLLISSITMLTLHWSDALAASLFDIQTIGVPGATAATTTPFAINNTGEIAGTYLDPNVGFRVFSLNGGAYASVDPVNAVIGSGFVSLNNSGQIVGFANTATPPSFGNYYLAANGAFTAFPPPGATIPDGASFSWYNDKGAIAGQTTSTAFISQNGVVITIAPPTTTSTTINAINNVGDAVGGFFPAVMPSPTANQAAFLYANGTYTILNPPGSTFTQANGISDDGVVVGDFNEAPIIGPNGNQVTPIVGFTYANGVYNEYSVPGEVETELFGINNAGQVVGYYSDENGNANGFSATTVPEPSSFLLIGSGLIGLIFVRLRARVV